MYFCTSCINAYWMSVCNIPLWMFGLWLFSLGLHFKIMPSKLWLVNFIALFSLSLQESPVFIVGGVDKIFLSVGSYSYIDSFEIYGCDQDFSLPNYPRKVFRMRAKEIERIVDFTFNCLFSSLCSKISNLELWWAWVSIGMRQGDYWQAVEDQMRLEQQGNAIHGVQGQPV